jgi:stearoyl-CoA desaturase (delta-9 desaturase)
MLWLIVSLANPYALDGWNGLLWDGFVRAAVVGHLVFGVNSICHLCGSRPFDTADQSRT